MWYTWTMWGVVAGIVVLTIIFTIGYGIYKLIKKRRESQEGYVVQTDHKDYEVNMY
jgi:O-antigen/teichoic acid export membrane protein